MQQSLLEVLSDPRRPKVWQPISVLIPDASARQQIILHTSGCNSELQVNSPDRPRVMSSSAQQAENWRIAPM